MATADGAAWRFHRWGPLSWAKRCWLAFVGAFALVVTAGLGAEPRGLFYYVPSEDGWESLLANARKISILAPQVFTVDGEGTVRGTIEEKVRVLAAQHGIRLMPLLVNAKFSPEVAHAILVDKNLRQRVISDALRLCRENGCWGLQLDFEGVPVKDGKHYAQFVREASLAFRARRLQFSVAVPSPLSGVAQPPPGGVAQPEKARAPRGSQQQFGGFPVSSEPYDLREIARHADFISLMTYDQHGPGNPPGPVAGYEWVEKSIRFVLRSVPRNKLSLGLSLYGRQWCNQQVSESAYVEVAELARKTGAVVRRHPQHRSPWLELDDTGCRKVVWFEDRQSLREKLQLIGKFRLPGFSAWRLGHEDPSFWQELPERRPQVPKSARRSASGLGSPSSFKASPETPKP